MQQAATPAHIRAFGFEENRIPLIIFTWSRISKSGTVLFFFVDPFIFEKREEVSLAKLFNVSLFWEKNMLTSKNIQIFFRVGQPYLLKVLFVIKNLQEWRILFSFIKKYSKCY